MVHNYGPNNFIASLHAEVDGKADIYQLHDMIDNAERQIKNDLGIICTIHMDPIVTDDETCNELKAFLKEAMTELNYDYEIHDFRIVVGNTHTNLIFDIVVPFDVKVSEGEIIDAVSQKVNEKRNYCYCVITVDRE
jgi:divalent metal cation (Fe/Co/Zn/Cd) transporter